MEDLFWVIVIIFFVVGPVIEKVLKGGRGAQPPARGRAQRQPPQRRMPAQRPADRDGITRAGSRRPETPARPRRVEPSSSGAQDLLPAELWEVLTGQRPMPRPPEPVEAPDFEVEEARPEIPPARVPARSEDAEAGDLMRRRQRERMAARWVEHKPPAVVSMESEPLEAEARHEAFHRKIDASAAAAQPAVPAAVASAIAPLLRNAGRDEIRRAILMQEVLGRPRGLE